MDSNDRGDPRSEHVKAEDYSSEHSISIGAAGSESDAAPESDEQTIEVLTGDVSVEPSDASDGELPETARKVAHRLERFSMAGSKHELIVSESLAPDANPVSAYLVGLSESSRRPMRTNLENIAHFVSGGRASAMQLAWWNLRFQHTSLIRSTLAETYAPSTANLMLSALRGVLRACFRLGYMSADDYGRAADVGTVRGSRLPRTVHRPGRAVRVVPNMLHG